MTDRRLAILFLKRQFKKIISNPKEIQNVVKGVSSNTGLSTQMLINYITLRDDIEYADDFCLFGFLKYYNVALNKYFNNTEISKFDSFTYKEKSIFPMKFAVVQILPNQWIGRITVKELMKLRDAQLINYNENAQRTMSRIVDGEHEYYKITLNKKAVNGIIESYENEVYIPNTITLNIPEDGVFDYQDGQLTVRKVDHFDILDGYHRYIAMSKLYNTNKKFDYAMELRLVNFTDDKAKQFIWQEDQKTKMRKVYSDAYNQNDGANKIVQRLNVDSTCNLSGMISQNKGIVNSAYLGEAISQIYMKGVTKKSEATKVILVTRDLKEKFNYITEQDQALLIKKWDRKFTVCVVLCCSLDIAKENLLTEIRHMYDEVVKNDKILYGRELRQIDLTRMTKLRKG